MSREVQVRFCESRGVRFPPATHRVVLCRSQAQAGAALEAVREILAGLGLELHPDKTKVVDLREGREGLDFLGCHFRARMSGRLWEQKRIIRYYLHRWPSQRAMKRLRAKIRDRTGRNRAGTDIRDVIADLNPVLRGWGNYFRTGNAADKFRQADDYVVWRLRTLMVKKRGRNLRAGQARRGRKTGSTGTACTGSGAPSAIRGQRNHVKKIIGKPYAGKPHVRIERGMGKPGQPTAPAPLTTNAPRQVRCLISRTETLSILVRDVQHPAMLDSSVQINEHTLGVIFGALAPCYRREG